MSAGRAAVKLVRTVLISLLISLLIGLAIGTWLRLQLEAPVRYIGGIAPPVTRDFVLDQRS